MKTLIIYHANCPDGFTAAWALWRKFGDSADYKPANYGQPTIEVAGYDRVIIADFSYQRDVMEKMAGQVELTVLDHHKTAEENLRGLPFAAFDMNKSGARLAWEWAFPDSNGFVPQIVLYAEDRDLWRFAMPRSREISQWLRMKKMDFDVWSVANNDLTDDYRFESAAAIGGFLLEFQNTQVDIMARRAVVRDVLGHKIPVTNATCFFSEVGERMCELFPESPCALYYFDRDEGVRQWGLRSRGDFDCTIIAKHFGGGGHQGAAGFTTIEQLSGTVGLPL